MKVARNWTGGVLEKHVNQTILQQQAASSALAENLQEQKMCEKDQCYRLY